ncbi:MAG: hypothetical protein Q7S09_02955 [bacterium]|nr:hypothetical protein [bacterium]
MDYKIILGAIATLVAFVSYIPYFRDVFLGTTKPHAFTWLVWGTLSSIGCAGQLAGGGGPGAWVTGFSAFVNFIIFFFALKQSKKNILPIDWASLLGAAMALVLWFITKSPLLSIVLVTIIDALGFVPTFRKSFTKPHEETLLTFFLSVVKFAIGLVALKQFSLVTALYPSYLVLANAIFVLMLVIRRSRLAH